MTTPQAPRGFLAVESGIRENGAGHRVASGAVMRMLFGRALQSVHADAFQANAVCVPTDSVAVVAVGACTGARTRAVHARAGRLAAPARG